MWEVATVLLALAVLLLSIDLYQLRRRLDAMADLAAAALEEVDHG